MLDAFAPRWFLGETDRWRLPVPDTLSPGPNPPHPGLFLTLSPQASRTASCYSRDARTQATLGWQFTHFHSNNNIVGSNIMIIILTYEISVG
ncbi:hypothetical protein RRG08_020496 [Elysia crispata]|uniref:Uncharacterized protein n=1 Tax=Elysia crispata TaxID=231223 RepID=A0AAE1DGU8_9GAST|nr:hypothetical protein RRG08_020496 [Elysia crispata]